MYKTLTEYPGGKHPKSGYLPLMAGCSEGQISSKLSEGYCERVISAANLISTDGNTVLKDPELEMMTILRINRNFMQFMRDNHPEVASHQRHK